MCAQITRDLVAVHLESAVHTLGTKDQVSNFPGLWHNLNWCNSCHYSLQNVCVCVCVCLCVCMSMCVCGCVCMCVCCVCMCVCCVCMCVCMLCVCVCLFMCVYEYVCV